MKNLSYLLVLCFLCEVIMAQEPAKPEIKTFQAFVWKSAPPEGCPFKQSAEFYGIKFLGLKSGFNYGDTWYPSWGADDKLYSPWTDGTTNGVFVLVRWIYN